VLQDFREKKIKGQLAMREPASKGNMGGGSTPAQLARE
jgi:hypothetical protein